MRECKFGIRGQSTLEYAIIVMVVVGALLAMQIYMKRGLQGKLKDSSDNIGAQYSAGNVTSSHTTTTATSSDEKTSSKGSSSTVDSSSTITGNENIGRLDVEQVVPK